MCPVDYHYRAAFPILRTPSLSAGSFSLAAPGTVLDPQPKRILVLNPCCELDSYKLF